jgi:hypothetical protein
MRCSHKLEAIAARFIARQLGIGRQQGEPRPSRQLSQAHPDGNRKEQSKRPKAT